MNLTLKLADFSPDYAEGATVEAYRGDTPVGKVIFDFNADDTCDQHRVTHAFLADANLSYYAQTKIAYDAACMVDSHFNPDAPDALTECLIEV